MKINSNSELEENNEIYINEFEKNKFNSELNELLNYKAPTNILNKQNKNEEDILFKSKDDYFTLVNKNKNLTENLEKNKKEYDELVK